MEQISISTATDVVGPANTGTPWVVNPLRTLVFVFIVGGTAVLNSPITMPSATLVDQQGRSISIISQDETARDQFSSLRIRWIGSDAIPVSEDTISKAKLLLDNLPGGIDQPHISPSADGEIGLSWIKGDDRFEAMLDPDERLVWITKIDGKYLTGKDVSVLSPADRSTFYGAINEFFGRV